MYFFFFFFGDHYSLIKFAVGSHLSVSGRFIHTVFQKINSPTTYSKNNRRKILKMNLLTSPLLVLSVILTTVPVFATFPSLDEIKVLLHVYFPTMNENTTIYSFLSDDRNVALLERFHEYSCIDLKRKRKIRSLDWFRDMFTLPIDQAILNGRF